MQHCHKGFTGSGSVFGLRTKTYLPCDNQPTQFSLAFVFFVEDEGIERARTAAFVVLACSQLFHSLNCRSQTESLFRIGILTNAKLLGAAVMSFLLQMAVVYLPLFQLIFKTVPLQVADWFMVVVVSSLPLWAMEMVKAVNRKVRFLNP